MRTFFIFTLLLLFFGACSEESTEENSVVVPPETPLKPVKILEETKSWYVRLVAKDVDRDLITFTAQIGVIDEEEGSKKYSSGYLEPFSGQYIDLRFEDPEGLEPGNYKANFKVYEANTSKVWHFSVRSDNPNAEIDLSWRGLYVLRPYTDEQGDRRYTEGQSHNNALLARMQIVDELSGESYALLDNGVVNTIHFNMQGHLSRYFRWELLNDEVETSVVSSPNRTNIEQVQKASQHIDNRFDMFSPPILH